MRDWRLIIDPVPQSGAWNMAVDEYLFRSVGEGGETAVRFYRWVKPTVSLGYSQAADKVADIDFCRRSGIDVVRRLTGGKLVLHDREITYSVSSADVSTFSSTLAESYRLISAALVCGLAKMGISARLAGPPPAAYSRGLLPCFAFPARDEIEIGGRKVVGSAQKRIGGRFLQHGSIPLTAEPESLRRVAASAAGETEIRVISLSEALGCEVEFEWAVGRLVDGFAEYFQAVFTPAPLSDSEIERVRLIERQRYSNPAWTLSGKVAFSRGE